MSQKNLVDRLVVEEYRDFADDPLGYVAERDDCLKRLVGDGADASEARDAWREFERRYLVLDGGGLTFSAHGIDRADALGETVYLDDATRSEIVNALYDKNGRSSIEALSDETGISGGDLLHNLWMLRRRGVVETRTDAYGDGRSAVLTEP